jgi:hypothetical protein
MNLLLRAGCMNGWMCWVNYRSEFRSKSCINVLYDLNVSKYRRRLINDQIHLTVVFILVNSVSSHESVMRPPHALPSHGNFFYHRPRIFRVELPPRMSRLLTLRTSYEHIDTACRCPIPARTSRSVRYPPTSPIHYVAPLLYTPAGRRCRRLLSYGAGRVWRGDCCSGWAELSHFLHQP